MTTKITQALMGGIIGTAAMTMIIFIAPMMGMPKMSPPAMLSMMMGVPIAVGWVMHFMIGIIFAMAYAFFFLNLLKKVPGIVLKGTIFGIVVFIFAQIMMAVMGMLMPARPMEGSMMLMIIGGMMGHIVYGVGVALFVKAHAAEEKVV